MSPREEKRLRDKVREALLTDEAMVRFMDNLFGHENYTYDQENDVWVATDLDHTGPGCGLIIIQRGGDWWKIVIPPAVLQ